MPTDLPIAERERHLCQQWKTLSVTEKAVYEPQGTRGKAPAPAPAPLPTPDMGETSGYYAAPSAGVASQRTDVRPFGGKPHPNPHLALPSKRSHISALEHSVLAATCYASASVGKPRAACAGNPVPSPYVATTIDLVPSPSSNITAATPVLDLLLAELEQITVVEQMTEVEQGHWTEDWTRWAQGREVQRDVAPAEDTGGEVQGEAVPEKCTRRKQQGEVAAEEDTGGEVQGEVALEEDTGRSKGVNGDNKCLQKLKHEKDIFKSMKKEVLGMLDYEKMYHLKPPLGDAVHTQDPDDSWRRVQEIVKNIEEILMNNGATAILDKSEAKLPWSHRILKHIQPARKKDEWEMYQRHCTAYFKLKIGECEVAEEMCQRRGAARNVYYTNIPDRTQIMVSRKEGVARPVVLPGQ